MDNINFEIDNKFIHYNVISFERAKDYKLEAKTIGVNHGV